ncbi:MAG: CDP-2,3-bis-(O-geranylgeranyl)-sn-glycerol synthase [Methanomicrobiales archaeon]|nr:CDP-2,3-bis-(O-geranylgeranyl)-sn-glycerol synthase [Methanomicrobiales archaeon]
MLPAYIPNPVAALVGGGMPVDLGRRCRDGRRVLGDGKTFRGLAAGIGAGILTGLLQLHLQNSIPPGFLYPHTLLSVMLMATGALLGDLVKSFFKRRIGKERGEAWPIADQYDLVAGAFVLNLVLNTGWFLTTMTTGTFIAILLLTPVLHRAVNIIGYLTGVKDVPW